MQRQAMRNSSFVPSLKHLIFYFFLRDCLEKVVINTNKCKAAFKMTFCYRHIPELFICVKCILP